MRCGPHLGLAAVTRSVATLKELSETPALSYREMSTRFRAAGHSASEVRLRGAWKRVVA